MILTWGYRETEKHRKHTETGDMLVILTLGHGETVSWCFEPSQPQRITSGLNRKVLGTYRDIYVMTLGHGETGKYWEHTETYT